MRKNKRIEVFVSFFLPFSFVELRCCLFEIIFLKGFHFSFQSILICIRLDEIKETRIVSLLNSWTKTNYNCLCNIQNIQTLLLFYLLFVVASFFSNRFGLLVLFFHFIHLTFLFDLIFRFGARNSTLSFFVASQGLHCCESIIYIYISEIATNTMVG